MRKKLCKNLSLLLSMVMCLSLFSVPALAAETTETVTNEDGTTTTTITTEISWSDVDGVTTTEGAEVTVEATTTDEQGRVVQESGTVEGSETTITETQTGEAGVEEKDTVTETVTGDTTVTVTPGEFETVDSSESSDTEAVAPVFTDGSEITVDLTPGSTATGTAEVDKAALAEQLVRPAAENSDVTDPDTGEIVGHKTVTVEDLLDEDGTVVGFTATSTEETSVTTILPDTVSSGEPPVIPQPQAPVTGADGVTTKVDVQPVYDEAGKLTGYQTTETKTSRIAADTSVIVLPERPAEYEDVDPDTGETTTVTVAELHDASGILTGYVVTTTKTDSEGRTRTAVETLSGTKNTSTLTEVTDVTVTTVTFTEIVGGALTTTTRTTTTETKKIVASDRTVTAEMGNVVTGENAGIIETTGVKADVAEPAVGKTNQTTDLYHRADKAGVEFDPDGYDFQWLGQYGLESAIRVDAVRVNEDGTTSSSDKWQAHQFVLVDKDGQEHYVYCADFAVSPQAGSRYGMENVEDADYYDSEAAAHIRAIARGGYWGAANGAGSLDAVKQMMVDAYNNGEINKDDYAGLATAWGFDTYLTDGMALAATQAALWTFGNSGDLSIDTEDPFTSYYQAVSGNSWRGLDSREWALTKALYDYLVGMTEEPTDRTTLINENNFATGASLTVGSRDEDSGKYNADLTFTLAVMPDTESDDLLVHVIVDGEIVETRRIAGDDSATQYGVIPRSEDGSYTLTGLKLADGVNIDLNLTGTQNIGEGVYLFTSEVKTEPWGYEDGEPVFSSQTFVGIESGKQTVDLSVSLNFTVTEATADVVTERTGMTERKTDTTETARTDTTTTTGGRVETAVTVTTTEQHDREWVVTWENNYTYPDPEPETPDEPEPPVVPEEPDAPDTPDEPETPEEPDTPDVPDEPPTEDIPDEDVPLDDAPEIPDTPMEDVPEDEPEVEIPDEMPPLSDVPQTGDDSIVWYILFFVCLIALAILIYQEFRDRQNNVID